MSDALFVDVAIEIESAIKDALVDFSIERSDEESIVGDWILVAHTVGESGENATRILRTPDLPAYRAQGLLVNALNRLNS